MKGAALILALAAAAALEGCSRQTHEQAGLPPSGAPPSDYLPAPAVASASRRADGAIVLTGTARAGAAVRLVAPDGAGVDTVADRTGTWTVAMSGGPAPSLYALAEDAGGRLVRARGYIALLPSPGPLAVVLRPGAGAAPIGPDVGLSVLALDYDLSGAAVVSGRARPGQMVRLSLDGRDAGEDRADGAGVFEASLSQPLRPGRHLVIATAAGQRADAALQAVPPPPIATGRFAASRADGSWRIDWITPGGGEQSTIVFDAGGAPA